MWLLLIGCQRTPPTPAAVDDGCPDGEHLRILHVNDLYRIGGRLDGHGGLSRLAALRHELEACGAPVLITHGGDFLAPSLLASELGSMHMVEALNALDGDEQAEDPWMFATFGNHEFDRGPLAELPDLVAASQFRWLDTSITWDPRAAGMPEQALAHLTETAIVEHGDLSIGFFGLSVTPSAPERIEAVRAFRQNHADVARGALTRLGGVDQVIALTHLDAAVDLELLAEVPEIDLVLGGHEHTVHELDGDGGLVLKSASDAVQVWDVVVRADGVEAQLVSLGPDRPTDPTVDAVIARWDAALDAAICETSGCLEDRLGTLEVALDGEERRIRSCEANLGSAIAGLARRSLGADAAVVNGGAVRLNQDLEAGTPFTERMLRELNPFESTWVVVELEPASVQAMLDHGLQGWPGDGQYLQVDGFRFTHDAGAARARDAVWLGPDGPVPLAEAPPLAVAVPGYLAKGGDGYTMLAGAPRREGTSETLVELVRAELAARGSLGAPRDSRIIGGGDLCPR